MFTAVDLVERSTGPSMLMINTHLDYWILVARRHGSDHLTIEASIRLPLPAGTS